MHENIVKYLKENKEKISKEVLIGELRKERCSEIDIKEGAELIYGDSGFPSSAIPPIHADQTANFWDLKSKKIYTRSSEKWLDFLFGFIVPFISVLGLIIFTFIDIRRILLNFIVLFVAVCTTAYIYDRRRFIAYGIGASILVKMIISFVIAFFYLVRFF